MAWQGIPFLLNNEKIEDTVRVALNSIPKIVIESPPDYTNAWITAGVSILAGLIPATIAVWTFKRNAENMKKEREHQQEFLRDDRQKQQDSFEQDRKIQIEIAKTNFNMQVLSGNRQEWINSLREVVSEYASLAPRVVDMCCSYKIQKDCVNAFIKQVEVNHPYSVTDEFKLKFKDEKLELYSRSEKLNSLGGRASFLQEKIKMMLNPKESEYREVIRLFTVLSKSKALLSTADDALEVYNIEYKNILDSISSLTTIMQAIFKREWERVKSGV